MLTSCLRPGISCYIVWCLSTFIIITFLLSLLWCVFEFVNALRCLFGVTCLWFYACRWSNRQRRWQSGPLRANYLALFERKIAPPASSPYERDASLSPPRLFSANEAARPTGRWWVLNRVLRESTTPLVGSTLQPVNHHRSRPDGRTWQRVA